MNHLEAGIAAASAAVVAIIAAVGGWLKAKQDRKPNKIDLQAMINEGFADLIEAHRRDRETLREEIAELREEIHSLCDHIERLEKLMREREIPAPPRPVVRLRSVKNGGD